MSTIIKQITSMKGMGVFRDYSALSSLPALRQYNLIYGFNGCGKTTLSRMFSSLGSGTVDEELPEGSSFAIELSNGDRLDSRNLSGALKDRVLVFNTDFVDVNFQWKSGTANPVFFLGKEQATLAAELEAKNAEIADLSPRLAEVKRTRNQASNSFRDHKTEAARLISEQLGLGRRYNATNLAADYESREYGADCVVDDRRREELRAIIAQQAPLPKLPSIPSHSFNLADEVVQWRALLGMTIGATALADLREHEGMLGWVRDGVTYHEKHALSACLFCGSDLAVDRLNALKAVIDGGFDTLVRDVAEAHARVKVLQNQLLSMKEAIPSSNDVAKDHQVRFATSSRVFRTRLAEIEEILKSVSLLLEQKQQKPNVQIDASGLISGPDARDWDTAFAADLVEINEVVHAHNASHDQFNVVQDQARATLKAHFLHGGFARYSALKEAEAQASESENGLVNQLRELTEAAEALKQQTRQHGPAAQVITDMVRCYLGHQELEISAYEEGYQVRRNGRPLRGSLSEGEKTAISLCYFISTIQAEGRNLKDLIIVVDDPISSLDTKALHYAFNVIRSSFGGAAQLILLTHNLQFMNEAKKWLRSKTEKEIGADKATAVLYFISVMPGDTPNTRMATIKEMPKHIRDYESEYQYLFSLVKAFAESEDGQVEYFYVVPNALRKVLEIFLAFRLPGADGLSSKIQNIVAGGHALDGARVQALDRLVQLESHADNLDDLVGFSSMTVEEIKDASEALLELMEVLDKEHYKKLCRVCR